MDHHSTISLLEVIDTLNDAGVVVRQRADGGLARFDRQLNKYGRRGDRYVVQALNASGEVVRDNQGEGGSVRFFDRSPKTRSALTYANIVVMSPGEKPWDFEDDPRELAGPWQGASSREILRSAGIDPDAYELWEPDAYEPGVSGLWIAPREKTDLARLITAASINSPRRRAARPEPLGVIVTADRLDSMAPSPQTSARHRERLALLVASLRRGSKVRVEYAAESVFDGEVKKVDKKTGAVEIAGTRTDPGEVPVKSTGILLRDDRYGLLFRPTRSGSRLSVSDIEVRS